MNMQIQHAGSAAGSIQVNPDNAPYAPVSSILLTPSSIRSNFMTVALGNDGGVFFTYDGARHWDYDNNLPIGQVYDIAIDGRDPYWVYGGFQDLGTFGFPSGTHSRGALTDDQVTFLEYGDGFQVAVDPTDPRVKATKEAAQAAFPYSLKAQEFGEALDSNIEAMHKDGTIVKILKSYGLDGTAGETGAPRLVQ